MLLDSSVSNTKCRELGAGRRYTSFTNSSKPYTGMIRISLVSNVLVMVRMMKLVAGKFMLRSFRRIKFGELGCL